MAFLKDELVMTRDFASPQEEAYLSLVRTCEMMQTPYDALFREYKVSSAQYNILRILRGSGEEGRTCGEIDRRLLRRGPDVTRLVDRMKDCGMVIRQRSKEDRRVVRVVLTQQGRELVDSLDQPVLDIQNRMMNNLDEAQCKTITALLAVIRTTLNEQFHSGQN